MQRDVLFWIWLADLLGAANRDFRKLIALYENPYELFHAEENEIERISGISSGTREKLLRKNLQRASDILEQCEKQEIGILTYGDDAFPNALREIDDPPILLYCRGKLPDLNKRLSIGMVGTRRMSAYGMQSAYKISYELAATDTVIVSGMASGIDGVCAAAAIAAKGSTVAVLGCGVDVLYPKHHKRLMDAICQNGVLLSEYAPGTPPHHYHFPVRNRLISGMTQGTMVVEAGLGSGSLITAKNAIAQGRIVFTVPANVGSKGAEGTNGLLRDGATMVLSTDDVLKPFQFVYAETLRTENLITARNASKLDMKYLDQLGVIELTSSGTAGGQVLRAAPKEEKTASPKSRTAPQKASTAKKEKNTAASVAPAVEKSPVKSAAPIKNTEEVLSSLTETQLAVFRAIPDDQAITVDGLNGLDLAYGDLIAALTMLEIMGLIQKLPGALYIKV